MGRKKERYAPTERIGVNAVDGIVLKELGWIFREQPIVDFGIDAHIELSVHGDPTGKLIALQIKTDATRSRCPKGGYVYHGDTTHLDYWLGHALPVILIVHLPKCGETLWAQVTADAVKHTRNGWSIRIPRRNSLGRATKAALKKVFEGTPGQQRLRKLTIDLPLMRHIKAGNKVSVELQDWVTRSVGRTSIKVFIDDRSDEQHSNHALTYFSGHSISGVAQALFPWAKVSLDEDFYDMNDELTPPWYESPDPDADAEQEGESVASVEHGPRIYPYAELGGGEVRVYRLQLDLNGLGDAFLTLSDHLESE
ncbi:hypothetical protein GCM10011487_37330 [Steroidobacter agaridevorans]|uniref:DUF4365 domain-containing protein n=1 Tax=Steroidobacter agaridevorans TaxID=2695856 RepID=A0A829YFN7_9GAMM|nr:DUF4365 domain-containing protein [Steroidobacter agaridevorans]GFE81733.1 hypothetical protein GCM10011487_37330 [Steroidobacter agaridevorans]